MNASIGKGKPKQTNIRMLKDPNGKEITDDLETANLLNTYFTSISKVWADSQPLLENPDELSHIYRITTTLQDIVIDSHKLEKDLMSISTIFPLTRKLSR